MTSHSTNPQAVTCLSSLITQIILMFYILYNILENMAQDHMLYYVITS
jgi:hypothetical protein